MKIKKLSKTTAEILKHGVYFDKENTPTIIDGVAQRDIEEDEILYYYGDTLRK